MKPRLYKLERNALKYAKKLNDHLDEVNTKRVEAGKSLSLVDFYYVGTHTDLFYFVVWVVFTDGRQALAS